MSVNDIFAVVWVYNKAHSNWEVERRTDFVHDLHWPNYLVSVPPCRCTKHSSLPSASTMVHVRNDIVQLPMTTNTSTTAHVENTLLNYCWLSSRCYFNVDVSLKNCDSWPSAYRHRRETSLSRAKSANVIRLWERECYQIWEWWYIKQSVLRCQTHFLTWSVSIVCLPIIVHQHDTITRFSALPGS